MLCKYIIRPAIKVLKYLSCVLFFDHDWQYGTYTGKYKCAICGKISKDI